MSLEHLPGSRLHEMPISMGQRIGIVVIFGLLVPAGLFCIPLEVLRVMKKPAASDFAVVENWIVFSTIVLVLLALVFFFDVFWWVLLSGWRGFVDLRLIKRFGHAPMAKWFGLPFKG